MIGFVLYACVAIVVLPRLAARGQKALRAPAVAGIRFAVAAVPFIIGIGAWSIGADEWSALGASLASALLVIVAAGITTSGKTVHT